MKKLFVAIFAMLFASNIYAQNLQAMYDCGKDCNFASFYFEMQRPDKWGSNLFIDEIHVGNNPGMEFNKVLFSRSLNFWQKSALKDFSIFGGYWGGMVMVYDDDKNLRQGVSINNTGFVGLEYTLKNKDVSKLLILQASFKDQAQNDEAYKLQFSAIWNLRNIFGAKGLSFNGIIRYWWEDQDWALKGKQASITMAEAAMIGSKAYSQALLSTFNKVQGEKMAELLASGVNPEQAGPQASEYAGQVSAKTAAQAQANAQESVYKRYKNVSTTILLAVPQLWYNIGQHFKCPNLSIGTRLEFGYNYNSNPERGFAFNPSFGIKWDFETRGSRPHGMNGAPQGGPQAGPQQGGNPNGAPQQGPRP